MAGMIYLCSPYSDPDPAVQEARFQAVCRHTAGMMSRGIHVFSPIAHTHPIAAYSLPTGWDFWNSYDRAFLEMCSDIIVLMLLGWKESEGVQAEIAIAQELGKPVSYIDPEG